MSSPLSLVTEGLLSSTATGGPGTPYPVQAFGQEFKTSLKAGIDDKRVSVRIVKKVKTVKAKNRLTTKLGD